MDASSAAHFSQSYAEARVKFCAAADAAGLDLQSQLHPLLGRDGETLAMDLVLQGRRDAVGAAGRGLAGLGPVNAMRGLTPVPGRPQG